MQILGQVVALHTTPGVTGPQAEACACTAICLLHKWLPPNGSVNHPSPKCRTALQPACNNTAEISPATLKLMLPTTTTRPRPHDGVAVILDHSALVGGSARKAEPGSRGPLGNQQDEQKGEALRSALRGSTKQLASLLQWACLHVQRSAGSSRSDEVPPVVQAPMCECKACRLPACSTLEMTRMRTGRTGLPTHRQHAASIWLPFVQ